MRYYRFYLKSIIIYMLSLRLGFTESTLLYYYFIQNILKIELDNDCIKQIKSLLNWLFTTSGFYSKQITGSYFDFSSDQCDIILKSDVYNNYMKILIDSIKDCDLLIFSLHETKLKQYIDDFKNFLSAKSYYHHLGQKYLYDHINNKNVLFVSSFADLIKIQIENGNCKKIYDFFPDIKNTYCYTTPYSFFNNGADNDILDTANKINKSISEMTQDYDIAIVSAGAYSSLIANYINKVLKKDALAIGGDLQACFGILNERSKYFNRVYNKTVDTTYWITEIPDKYKPHDYMKIENGCYW
jgi:hypothetical protein